MKLKIVGSGGMFQIPNPFCKCPICEEARIKRGRYERLGPSIYIEDIQMLIDTPEDICNLRRAAATGAFASGHSAEHNGHPY